MALVDLQMTPAISASCLGITRQSAPNLLLSPQRPAMAAFGLSCPMKSDLLEDSVDSEVCWNCLCQECDWTTCSPPVETLLFQDASKSFVEDGMWDMVSNAKSSNPPLSKEMFLQERELADDHWEDDTDGDHENWGEDDESEEDN